MTNSPAGRTPVWLTILASGVILTGIQPILPALPEMQRELGLSDSEISLITSMYFLPSVLLAFPTGLLADRFGRRSVFVVSLAVFGLCGLALSFTRSFTAICVVRALQGSAFAAVHPLSITMIGDARSGAEQVTAQGIRYTALTVCEAILPVIGGLVVALSWYAPFTLQIAALPVALVGWFLVPGQSSSQSPLSSYWKQLLEILKDKGALTIQLSGFLRFLFKFAFMTYVPILLATKRDFSLTFVGVALGGSALFGAAAATLAGRLVRRFAPSRLLGLSLILIGVPLILLSVVVSSPMVLLVCFLFGAGDGAYGVLQNAMMTQVAPAGVRAGFIAATASVRNFGKFLAPSILGLSVLVLPLETSFVLIGVLALSAVSTVFLLSCFDQQLMSYQGDGKG